MRTILLLLLCTLAMAGEETTPPPAAAPAPANLPEGCWPIGFQLDAAIAGGWKGVEKQHASGKADVLVWSPPDGVRLRAVFLVPNNSDSKAILEHAAVREVAARQGIGLVYLRFFEGSVVERSDPPDQAEAVFSGLLAEVATRTGLAGYHHAPWITLGKSSRGRFPFRTTWRFPTRVIASISYHGETPTWPMEAWSKVGDETVLHLAINGEQEWDGTWYRHVRPCLLDYHLHRQWLAHQVVLHGVGHGNYADASGSPGWGKPVGEGVISCRGVWDYIARYIDTAMNLRVPADALLGKLGEGFKVAMQALDCGRIGIAAQSVGVAQACLDEAIEYMKGREQFGNPLTDFQGLRWRVAEMATEIEASRLLCLAAASAKDLGRRYTMEASMAKMYASEMVNRVAGQCLQMHGGYGYCSEYAIERHYRDARVFTIYEGTSEIQRVVISNNLLVGLPPMKAQNITQFLGGTGLLIVVSVMLDFVNRIEANLIMRNYSGFLDDEGNAPGKIRRPKQVPSSGSPEIPR